MKKKNLDFLRTILLMLLSITSLSLCTVRLMRIQLVEGESLLAQSIRNNYGYHSIPAARGEIVDKYGNPLVKNKVTYNVIVEYSFFPKDVQEQNEILLKTAKILKNNNQAWIENIPITQNKPYSFSGSESAVAKLKSNLRLNSYATAENCIDKLIEKYKISDSYTDEEKRIIAGIRYEMLISDFSVNNNYTLANNISVEAMSTLKELSFNISGINIIEGTERYYPDGTIFPHGIGYINKISAEEYQELKDEGYAINDLIGKTGIEKAMEEYLRGQTGLNKVTVSSNKEFISSEIITPAVPGNTVQLTIDADFQKDVQDMLADHIFKLQTGVYTKKGIDLTLANAGAIVVLDAKTGGVLAMASYPNYDMNELLDDYYSVQNAKDNPLVNRAINGSYRPGSTFKTITSVALLNEGVITRSTTSTCKYEYPFFDIIAHCNAWHGQLNVVNALRRSCNIFFYEHGYELGIKKLVEYEQLFGLGVDLGLEIGGRVGYLASPDTFQDLGIEWTSGQILQACIGQSEISITPLAMAVQAMTLANDGVRYKPYLVDSVWNYNMTECIERTTPTIESTIHDNTGYVFDTVREGMIAVADDIADGFSIKGLPYKVAVKTGTPQTTKTGQNSALIGYYPAHDPEIAFSIIIENGEYSKYLVKQIIDSYYGY